MQKGPVLNGRGLAVKMREVRLPSRRREETATDGTVDLLVALFKSSDGYFAYPPKVS
jgi:hypothetical protein